MDQDEAVEKGRGREGELGSTVLVASNQGSFAPKAGSTIVAL